MSFKTIRHAQAVVWPIVQESLRLHQASRAAAREGKKLSSMEQRDVKKSWSRVVSEETVWAIARSDLLGTPEQAAVLDAAKKWAQSWIRDGRPPSLADGCEPEDLELYNAVQTLAASFEPPTDEPLQLSV